MIPELVIFDCDGVLVDTEGPVARIIAESLTRHGLKTSEAEIAAFFIGGTMESAAAEARRRGAALPADWVDLINAQIFDRMDQGVPCFDGLVPLLDALDAAGVPQYVASNGPMEKMRRSLGPSGLWDRFAGRILSREQHAPKPDPAMVLYALAQTGARPVRSVMIDDSPTGCRAAIAGGVRCIGFATEGQAAELAALGAETALSMAEVKRLILP